MGARKLTSFLNVEGLPATQDEIGRVLRCSWIKDVICCALGPEGTNIHQACRNWAASTGIEAKTSVFLCSTPELSLEFARTIDGPGSVSLFWTCAVYLNLYRIFFEAPETLPFFVQYVMPLDSMQLCTRTELASIGGAIPANWRIASHPSPAPLLCSLPDNEVVIANSNAAAAQMCAAGRVEACITTERARVLSGLVKFHEFGSPPMVFFGGVTEHSARLIADAYAQLTDEPFML